MQNPITQNPIATIEMENGRQIIVELDPAAAPNTVNSFIWLANQGSFDHHAIERIVPGYVVDMSYKAFSRPECQYFIENESPSQGFANPIKIEPGVIFLGGYEPEDISGSEFVFAYATDHEKLVGKYPGFGRVIEGWDEIARWETVPTRAVPSAFGEDMPIHEPLDPLVIKQVRVETFGVAYPPPVKKKMSYKPVTWA